MLSFHMYICICNPFTDKDVHKHLATQDKKARVKDVYFSCTGGEEMNCGTCACELKKIVDTYNNALTIEQISDEMQVIAKKRKEIV